MTDYANIETVKQQKRYCGGKLGRTGFIVSIVGGVILVLGIVIIIGIFAIFPAVAQKKIDNSEMTIKSLSFNSFPTDPKDKILSFDSVIQIDYDSAFSTELEETDVDMCYKGKCFGTFKMPGFELDKDEESMDLTVNASLNVYDQDGLDIFAAELITGDKMSITFKAEDQTLKAIGLSTEVDIDKDIPADGLNSFGTKQSWVSNVTGLSCSEDEPEFYLGGNVQLYNPSSADILGMGKINFTVSYTFNGEKVAVGYVIPQQEDVILLKGWNNQSVINTIHVTKENHEAAQDLFIKGLTVKKFTLHLSGTNPYMSNVPMLQEGFKSLEFDAIYDQEKYPDSVFVSNIEACAIQILSAVSKSDE